VKHIPCLLFPASGGCPRVNIMACWEVCILQPLYSNVVIRCKLAVCPETIALALTDTFFGAKCVIEQSQLQEQLVKKKKSVVHGVSRQNGNSVWEPKVHSWVGRKLKASIPLIVQIIPG
jgi:hypothetical protein